MAEGARVIAFPVPEAPTRSCADCIFGEAREGQIFCLLADDLVTDPEQEAAECDEWTPRGE